MCHGLRWNCDMQNGCKSWDSWICWYSIFWIDRLLYLFMHMFWIQYEHFSVAFTILWIVFPFRSWFIILGNGFDTCVHKSSHCKNCCWLLHCCSNCCAISCKKCKICYRCRGFVSNISKLFLSWLFSLFLSCYTLLFKKWTLRGLCIGEWFYELHLK